MSRWVLRTRNVSDKSCWENQNTHFMFNNFFFPKIVPFMRWCEKKKYGTGRQASHYNIIRRMRFKCWKTKATHTHSEYVILITFQRQKWFHERASILRLYVRCLSCNVLYVYIFYFYDLLYILLPLCPMEHTRMKYVRMYMRTGRTHIHTYIHTNVRTSVCMHACRHVCR